MRNGSSNQRPVAKSINDEPVHFQPGSGNVFADLDLPNPELALAKAKLVQCIREIIAERNLTHAKAAVLLGLERPRVSALLRGRVGRFTFDRLFRVLNMLGQRVEVVVGARLDLDGSETVLVERTGGI